ncbi:tRNA (adenosine(37)-N6)-threonylcarbamoyltransferase complex ATPase subunit type 1 TsaE [Nesterenkonia populi]
MSQDAAPAAPLPGEQWTLRTLLEDLEATESFARALAAQLAPGDLLVLTGGLGAGKTTFTQSLGESLGVEGPVTSPTFVLARVHTSLGEGPDLVHVDAYRTDAEGLESLDLPAALPHSITVVEWGRSRVEGPVAGPEGSWLDIELLRAEQEPAYDAALSSECTVQTDFTESEEELLGAPRTAVLRGYGPRWAEPVTF